MTEYKKVFQGSKDVKLVSIPKRCSIQVGDYVKIDPVEKSKEQNGLKPKTV